MIGFLEGLVLTLKTTLRRPVTAQYPDPEDRLGIANRYMGFPALTWDYDIEEPYCTGCMVCIRDCPTQCMSAKMKDNPLYAEGKSRRRKIVDEFEINLGRCILCGICVDVCNFDAIEMSHEHELSKYERDGNRVDLRQLVEMGQEYQAETGWGPKQPEKNSGVPGPREDRDTKEPVLGEGSTEDAGPTTPKTEEEKLAAARARDAAKASEGARRPEGAPGVRPAVYMTKDERLAAVRARASARKQAAEGSENQSTDGVSGDGGAGPEEISKDQ